MHRSHRKFESGEQLVQYAIEIFDLVDVSSARRTGKRIDRQLRHADVALAAARYHKAKSVTVHIASTA